MKRKVKKQHWGLIAAAGSIVLVLAMPLDLFVKLIYETQQKVEITEALLVTLTEMTKAGIVLISALAALIFYKVIK